MESNFHLNNAFLKSPVDFDNIKLVQIGRMYCSKQTTINEHPHLNWFELTIVTDGEGTIITNGVKIPVKYPDIYLSFPCDTHGIISSTEKPLKYDFISFTTDSEPYKTDLENIMQTFPGADKRIFTYDNINRIVSAAIAEFDSESPYLSNEMISSMLKQTLIYTIRVFNKKPNQSTNVSPTAYDILCYRLMNYIDTHIYTLKNLTELAEVMGYDYNYLSSLFSKHTGNTLAEYYRRKKLITAKQLLLENKYTESKIAELLGYSSLYSFIRAFRNMFGMSPGKFRRIKCIE